MSFINKNVDLAHSAASTVSGGNSVPGGRPCFLGGVAVSRTSSWADCSHPGSAESPPGVWGVHLAVTRRPAGREGHRACSTLGVLLPPRPLCSLSSPRSRAWRSGAQSALLASAAPRAVWVSPTRVPAPPSHSGSGFAFLRDCPRL